MKHRIGIAGIILAVLAAAAFALAAGGAPAKKFKITAKNWSWSPNRIEVAVGSRVVIDFLSEEGDHTFSLPAYHLEVELREGTRAQVEFVAEREGTFDWRCSLPCGDGCPKMTGTLVVGGKR